MNGDAAVQAERSGVEPGAAILVEDPAEIPGTLAHVHPGRLTRAPAAIDPETGAMLVLIERLALNSDVDPDKMQKFLDMQERIIDKKSSARFNQAMSKAQSEMRQVSADATNPQTYSKYASYAALDRELRPVYTANGFALSFDTGDGAPEGCIRVLCYVSHDGGHSRTYRADMPADGKGARGGDVMTKTHATGSAMSYGMRYLLKMIFNVAVGEEDDDGNGGKKPEPTKSEGKAAVQPPGRKSSVPPAPPKKNEPRIDAKQLADLNALITEVGANTAEFFKWYGIKKLEELPVRCFEPACKGLRLKGKNRNGKQP